MKLFKWPNIFSLTDLHKKGPAMWPAMKISGILKYQEVIIFVFVLLVYSLLCTNITGVVSGFCYSNMTCLNIIRRGWVGFMELPVCKAPKGAATWVLILCSGTGAPAKPRLWNLNLWEYWWNIFEKGFVKLSGKVLTKMSGAPAKPKLRNLSFKNATDTRLVKWKGVHENECCTC